MEDDPEADDGGDCFLLRGGNGDFLPPLEPTGEIFPLLGEIRGRLLEETGEAVLFGEVERLGGMLVGQSIDRIFDSFCSLIRSLVRAALSVYTTQGCDC